MRIPLVVLAGALVAASCSTGADDPPVLARDVTGITDPVDPVVTSPEATDPTAPPPAPLEYSIEWTDIGDRLQEGWLTVPLDYADPQGDTIDLYVVRHLAGADAVGPMLANRGGPGAAGSVLATSASGFFRGDIVDNFDIIGWDPRGTGRSESSVDCIDDDEYDRFFSSLDITPDDDAERRAIVDLAEEYAERCVDQNPELAHIGTNNSARDMDALRQALGAAQISYFGFSYGSELGGVWATLFPTTVRAAVFDGASDPAAGPVESSRQQGMGFEAALDTFLARCSADRSCAFHNDGDAEGAFDRLMEELDENPLPTTEGRVLANRSVAVIALAQSMYSDRYWPAFERALADAAAGDGLGLLQLHDLYYERRDDGSYSNLIEAFGAINCADSDERLTVEEADARVDAILEVAPRIFPYTTGSYVCGFFPESADPRIDISGVGAGPIVVVGTTGDAATPLESTRAMADTLEDGRLVIVEGDQHTGYQRSECVQDIVHEYLLQLVPPADGTECSS